MRSVRLSSESSRRIQLLRYPLIVGIVFLHSYALDLSMQGHLIVTTGFWFFIQTLTAKSITMVNVPIYFTMSAYLLYVSFSLTSDFYLKVIRSRFQSLIVPFFFWNFCILIAYALLLSIPAIESLFAQTRVPPLDQWGFFKCIDLLVGLTGNPINFQFWFIRDLFILIMFSPLIFLIIRKTSSVFLLCLLAIWFLVPIFYPGIETEVEAFLFFFLGAWLAMKGFVLEAVDRVGPALFGGFICLAALDSICDSYQYGFIVSKVCILFGVPSIYWVIGKVRGKMEKRLKILAAASFFVYATHEPFGTLIKKMIYKFSPLLNDFLSMLLFFLIPIIVTVICTSAFLISRKFFPRFTSVVTGHRYY
jgi:hypothetical protein